MKQGLSSRGFLHLRWFAFLGQAIVLALALFAFKLTLPWTSIIFLLVLIPVSNFIAALPFTKEIEDKRLIGTLLVVDTLLLTGVLCQAGGPTNPFTIFYFLQVVLAALMLNAVWTWIIAGLSSLGFSALFLFSTPIPEWEHHGAHQGLSLHLHGMLVAYITAALLAAYFLNKIAAELKNKERKLERLENLASNQQKLASLTTITASAAHELGTPLGTISIISHELEKYLMNFAVSDEVLEDIALLKSETNRCKLVLQELAEKTGDLLGEHPQTFALRELINDALSPLTNQDKIKVGENTGSLIYNAPRKALTLAVRALIKNALEATSDNESLVAVEIKKLNEKVEIVISDSGPGMSAETKERIGEPFYSTKGSGKGMGLGIYLSRLTVEQLGGSLSHKSDKSSGTTATLIFPENCGEIGQAA